MTGAELKALRLNLQLTQAEMGEKLGVGRDAIAKYEGGAKINKSVEIIAESILKKEP